MYRTFHIIILQLEVLSSSNEERMSEGVSVPVKEKTKDPVRLRACLVLPNSRIWHYVKRRFPVTSNLWYMHGVLNVDEIKN